MHITRSAVNFSTEDFLQGFDILVKRHGYIEFLGLTMDYVPDPMPHENGALTFAVLRHISMPRFIFRGKAPLPSDTEITARYTGLGSIGNQNTSISIGHLGELYIDFGRIGGVLAMMIIGLLTGRVYSALRRRPPSVVAPERRALPDSDSSAGLFWNLLCQTDRRFCLFDSHCDRVSACGDSHAACRPEAAYAVAATIFRIKKRIPGNA